jgi:phage shock protein PspC (stress-responsive transcriptional regulator)
MMGGLKRAKRDRWIMGVCGGIAHRYGWNSTVVRLVTIVLAIIIPRCQRDTGPPHLLPIGLPAA